MLKAIAANIARIAAKATLCAAACQLAAVVLIAPVALMPGEAMAQATIDCPGTLFREQQSETACRTACIDGYFAPSGTPATEACVPEVVCDADSEGKTERNDTDNVCVCPGNTRLLPVAGTQSDMFCQTPAAYCNSQTGTQHLLDDETDPPTCGICPPGEEKFSGNCQEPRDCSAIRGQIVNRAEGENECVCPNPNHSVIPNVFYPDGTGGAFEGKRTCAPALPPHRGAYNDNDCRAPGWVTSLNAVRISVIAGIVEENIGDFRVVESCNIRMRFVASTVVASAGQIQANDVVNSCVLRENEGVTDIQRREAVGFGNTYECDHAEIFGDKGLPETPESRFILNRLHAKNSSGDHLVVAFGVEPGVPDRITYEKKVIPLYGAPVIVGPGPGVTPPVVTSTATVPPPTTDPDPDPDPVATPTPSGGSGGPGAFMGGGILLVGVAAYFISSDPQAAALSFDPLASYAFEDGVGRYRYGSRLEFRRDDWTLWWTADESRHGDSSAVRRYGYGGEWSRDAWRAAVSAYSDADAADMEMRAALETEWTLHDWRLRPAWRLSASGGGESEWRVENALNLAAELARAGWTVRPSVDANLWPDDAAAARLRLRVGREF